jgi:hypothetical protein
LHSKEPEEKILAELGVSMMIILKLVLNNTGVEVRPGFGWLRNRIFEPSRSVKGRDFLNLFVKNSAPWNE